MVHRMVLKRFCCLFAMPMVISNPKSRLKTWYRYTTFYSIYNSSFSSIVFQGRKSVGNDLDNASLIFDRLRVPLSSLLSRYLVVSPTGHVSKPQGNKRSMDIIGQRLFSGRVAVVCIHTQFSTHLSTNGDGSISQTQIQSLSSTKQYNLHINMLSRQRLH